MNKQISIAIDGPAGAGKSTVAKAVAKYLGYIYIDTGAMYRALTLAVLEAGFDVNNEGLVHRLIGATELNLAVVAGQTLVYLNNREVSSEIRSQRISDCVSIIASYKTVRDKMLIEQRKIAFGGGVVMDGRDIGTVVLPNAELKLFLTASVKVRALRRFNQYNTNLDGEEWTLDMIEKNILERDELDSSRLISPLVQAPDSILLDNSELSLEETVHQVVSLAERVIENVSKNNA